MTIVDICKSSAMELLDLQRFHTLARQAVERFDPELLEVGIPWELSTLPGVLSVYSSDEEDLKRDFVQRILPRFTLILTVTLVDEFIDKLWKAAGQRRQKSKGFGFPVPPGFNKEDLDDRLTPIAAQYVEIKAARNVLVHRGGIVDEQYIKQAGVLAKALSGEPYPLTEDAVWNAFVQSRDLITVIELLWKKLLDVLTNEPN